MCVRAGLLDRKDGRGKGLFKSEYHDYDYENDFVGGHARYISFCSREKTIGGGEDLGRG